MSREIVALCDRLLPLPKDDEWSDRVVALEELQELVRSSRRGSSSSSSNAEWSASTLLLLHEPMVRQLKDLRSAVVREACAAVSLLAVELGSGEFGALGAKHKQKRKEVDDKRAVAAESDDAFFKRKRSQGAGTV